MGRNTEGRIVTHVVKSQDLCEWDRVAVDDQELIGRLGNHWGNGARYLDEALYMVEMFRAVPVEPPADGVGRQIQASKEWGGGE